MGDGEVIFPKDESKNGEGLVVSAPKPVILTPAEPILTNSVPENSKQLIPAPKEVLVEPEVEPEVRYNVYQTQLGDYYAALTPKSIGDCMKPFPSPALYQALTSRLGELAHRDAVIDTINHEGNGVPGAQRCGICMLIGT